MGAYQERLLGAMSVVSVCNLKGIMTKGHDLMTGLRPTMVNLSLTLPNCVTAFAAIWVCARVHRTCPATHLFLASEICALKCEICFFFWGDTDPVGGGKKDGKLLGFFCNDKSLYWCYNFLELKKKNTNNTAQESWLVIVWIKMAQAMGGCRGGIC